MMRRIFWVVLAALLVGGSVMARPVDVVVLTEEPVAEFRLPDGSILKNAYVWRRTSKGIMIIHDDGQYFMNYSTLPDNWKAAYLGEGDSMEAEEAKEAVAAEEARNEAASRNDRYRISGVLKRVPSLAPETCAKLLERGAGEEYDKGALVIALLQALLDGDKESANRCILYIEELDYEVDEVARDLLLEACFVCSGSGSTSRTCMNCSGTGECPECHEPITEMGKRSTRNSETLTEMGKRSSQDTDCKTCGGSGACVKCGGSGKIKLRCSKCEGSGKIVAKEYCETVRDKWVRDMNALVSGEAPASVVASPSVDIGSILEALPGIGEDATAYYKSCSYDGHMDTNLVVVCLMHSLLEEDLAKAKRFNIMLEVLYPDNEVIDIEDYLQQCERCDGKGWGKQSCGVCGGSGECPKCEGDGDSMNMSNWSVTCSACNGTGKCPKCGGTGKVNGVCRDCKGLGRVFDVPRCEIRRELLIDELNEYYRAIRSGGL